MTPEEKQLRVAEFLGEFPRYLLVKRGLFYRPNACGYTDRLAEAGRFSPEEASDHVYPYGDEPVTKRLAPVPDYLHDLNATDRMESRLRPELTDFYEHHLGVLTHTERLAACRCLIGDRVRLARASAATRMEAFGLANRLWEEGE